MVIFVVFGVVGGWGGETAVVVGEEGRWIVERGGDGGRKVVTYGRGHVVECGGVIRKWEEVLREK